MAFGGFAEAGREARLRELSLDAQRRSVADSVRFLQAERNLRQCRASLAARLSDPPRDLGLTKQPDGTRRLLARPEHPELGAFLARSVADDGPAQAQLAAALVVVRELGPSWCEDLPAMAIASPARWLATWGTAFAELPATMLPDDPVLLATEAMLLASTGDEVRWSAAYFEPATETWCVTALLPTTIDAQRLAIYHPVPVRTLLDQVGLGMTAGTTIAVLDAQGRAIACTGLAQPAEHPGEVRVQLPARLAAAMVGVDVGETGVRDAAGGDGWIATAHLAGPGWTVVTHLPPEVVLGPARERAKSFLLLGALTCAALAIAIAIILHWRIATPLKGLRDEVARLASGGRPAEKRPGRGDEISGLIAAFDHMATEVNASHRELSTALDALGRREQLYRALFAAAADAVLVLREGRVIEANQRAGRLFDVEPVTLEGSGLVTLAPERQPDGALSSVRLAELLATETRAAPWRARRQSGAEIDTEVSVGRVRQPEGDLLLVALRDVTERNQLDLQLRQVQKMETIGQLAGGVAHDFNNLLTPIVGSAEMLARRLQADERGRELVTRILQASERAAGLVSKLLAFARKGRQVTTPIDIHVVINETCALLERSIDRRIILQQHLAAGQTVVIGDTNLLQNALLNLGLNARDAMPNGGELWFGTEVEQVDAVYAAQFTPALAPGAHIRITVRDSGTGMPPEIQARLFEPFFTTKPPGKGTGLGLTAVLRTIQDHRGGVRVETRAGEGTSFHLLLPLSERSAARQIIDQQPVRGQGRVLVIDDDDLVRGTAVELLRALGYETAEARDGQAGVEVYLPGVFDVVLIDMEMPRMRGSDCLRVLRERDPKVCAVLCSGYNREGAGADLRAEGWYGFLRKPYRLYDLSRALVEAMANKDSA